jgi:hypothetical protein
MTQQATPDFNAALADARKATEVAQALANDHAATVVAQRATIERLTQERDGLVQCGRDTLALLESYKAGDGLHTTINIWDDMIARWKGWLEHVAE